eukprot:1142810-Pelagomonas_calceolata.AAC.2
MPGTGKCEKLPLDKKQIARAPHKLAADITAPIPCQSNPNLQLKVADWKCWAYTDGSCQAQDGNTIIGAGVYHHTSDSINLVKPNGAGIIMITNTIGRAELAAVAAALAHGYTHIATDSLSSLHQLKEQILCLEKHRHHVQGDVSKKILNLARTSQDHIFFYKIAKQATTLITEACYLMQIRALAMPSGTCPVSQPERNNLPIPHRHSL